MGIYVTQKSETTVSYDIQVLGKVAFVLKIVETKNDGRKVPDTSETFFIERRAVEPEKPTAKNIEKAERFLYFSPENLELLWDDFEKGEPFHETWRMVAEETVYIKTLAGIDQHNFYRIDGEDHALWRAGEDLPTSTPIYVDFVVGIDDERYHLDSAEKTLAINNRVSGLRRIDVPFHCQDDSGRPKEALVFAYEFSQKQLNQLYREHPDKCNPSWLQKLLKGWDLDNFNFLKLKRARRKSK